MEGLDEVPRYLFVWLVMIGAAAAMERGEHTALVYFRDRLGPAGRASGIVTTALAMLLFLSMIRSSLVLVPNATSRRARPGAPLGYVYAVPVGAVLILLPMARELRALLRELWPRRS